MALAALQRSQSALFNRPKQTGLPAAKDDLALDKRHKYQFLEFISTPDPSLDAVVQKVRDIRTREEFAAKVYNPEKFYQCDHEAMYLLRIQSFPHALQLRETTLINGRPAIITEFVPGKNLYAQLYELSSDRIVLAAKKVLKFLKRAHKEGLIHGDLRTENVLLCADGRVKIIDPALMQDTRKGIKDEVIQTRYYRAPEVVLGDKQYGPSCDMWSFACVLYELYAQSILFPSDNKPDSPENIQDHMHRIVAQIGPPTTSYLKSLDNSNKFFADTGRLKEKIDLAKIGVPWKRAMRAAARERGDSSERVGHFIGLMERMLCYTDRISAKAALKHPLFAKSKEDHKARK